jgi:hypothetical protein
MSNKIPQLTPRLDRFSAARQIRLDTPSHLLVRFVPSCLGVSPNGEK